MTMQGETSATLLSVRGLRTEFRTDIGWRAALSDIDLDIMPNETLAIVGESGSGKSVTALSVMRLLPDAGARIAAGRILFEGQDLAQLPEQDMEKLRGNRIGMVFQEPMTALNPTMTVGDQIAEPLRLHAGLDRAQALAETLRLLDAVRMPSAARRVGDYPHAFSGGMRQRVAIAMAIACRPKLLIADEPTTALDVTIQAQVLALLQDLKTNFGMGMIFITHNLGVVAEIADRVAVMYAGEVVETAPVEAFFARPRHPYSEALMRALPRPDLKVGALDMIPGAVPSIRVERQGCAFSPRCTAKVDACATVSPALVEIAASHALRCLVRGTPVEIAA